MPAPLRPITRQVLRDFVEDDLPDAEKAAVERPPRRRARRHSTPSGSMQQRNPVE